MTVPSAVVQDVGRRQLPKMEFEKVLEDGELNGFHAITLKGIMR
jgi:hypothetical protein